MDDVSAAGRILLAEYADQRQRARAIQWLGWLACHTGADGHLEWWAIPAWIPAAQLLTARRLTAWAVLSASAGLAIAATIWAAIPFGIVGWIAAVQAVFVSPGDRSAPLVLRPGGPRMIVPRRLRGREADKFLASAFALLVTAIPFLVRLWAAPADSRPGATAVSTYRADRMTSVMMGIAWTPFGALLVALPLIPALGSVDGLVAMVLFALGTGAFAGLMTGRYPLLKLTELMVAVRWPRHVGFLRLLEDAADRGVLRRSGAGYQFADDETRTRLAMHWRAAFGDHARRRDHRAGIGARLAGTSDATVTRVTLGIAIGGTLAGFILMALIGTSAHDPVWVIVLLSVLFGVLIIGFCLRVVKEVLGDIVRSARWRQANLSGAHHAAVSGLRGLIVTGVVSGTAWLLIAQDGSGLGHVAVLLLPAAFAGGCGAWACLLVFPRLGAASGRWRRRLPDALMIATTAATVLLVAERNRLTDRPFAGLLFPPCVWAAFRLWRAMNGSDRLAVKAGADITLSLLLGAEVVLVLVWLANVLDLPRAEIVAVREAADHAGSLADLPWWAWTGLYVLLAGSALAFVRWPGRLARTIRWFGRLRVVPAVNTTRRTLTVVHIGLLAIVFVGLTAPAALTSTFQRQMKSAYTVALQRTLEAKGELAVYAEVRAAFTPESAQPVLTDIVLKIHDIDSPGADENDANATPTETDLAHRVGELQALALGATLPRTLLTAEQATAAGAGFDGPIRDAPDAGQRLATIQHEQAADDAAAKRADQAADLAASAVASTISIPHISDNEVFQIVREYLSGLIEGSPLKDTFAAWIGHLAGAKAPPGADQVVIPDPQRLKLAALTVLSGEVVIVDAPFTDPAFANAETESPIDAAVDLANQSRYIQQGSGPCAGCVRSPTAPEDHPVEPPDDHVILPLSPHVSVVAVVVAGLEDLHLFVVGSVDQTVLIVDPARPVPGNISLQRLRLADAVEGVPLDLTDQAGDPGSHLPIRAEPEQEIFPRVRIEVDAPHASPARDSSSSIVLATADVPALSRATASISRRALAGDRSR